MRFAVLSDIQGNLTALQAILHDIDGRQGPVDRIVAAGDLVGLGPQPNEVIALLREREIEAIRGNYDDAVAFERPSSGVDFVDAAAERADWLSVEWTRQMLNEDNLAYLRDLPRDLRLYPGVGGTQVKKDELKSRPTSEGRGLMFRSLLGSLWRPSPLRTIQVLIVHGSTRALNERVMGDTANSILSTIANEARVDLLVSGHGGFSFRRMTAGMTFVGVGGVSGPYAQAGQAEYAMVDVQEDIRCDFQHVDYNWAEQREAMRQRGLPVALVPSRDG